MILFMSFSLFCLWMGRQKKPGLSVTEGMDREIISLPIRRQLCGAPVALQQSRTLRTIMMIVSLSHWAVFVM